MCILYVAFLNLLNNDVSDISSPRMPGFESNNKIETVRPQILCIFNHSTVLKREVSKSKSQAEYNKI